MKTYLMIWHSSEGENPLEVMQRMTRLGFKPVRGKYDLEFDHGKDVELMDIIQLGTMVHETLKGTQVLYKLETPEQ